MTVTTKRRATWTAGLAICLTLTTLGGSAWAEKGGNGGGGGKGGGGKGGDITPAKITFADEMGAAGNRISGDGFGPYVHGQDGAEVYLGTGGAEGDIFFRLSKAPGRGLWLDFSACYPDPLGCTPPYAPKVDFYADVAVAPGDVVASGTGLFGMVPGETIEAPMDILYDYDQVEKPGFLYFDRDLKGKNLCKNKSLFVTIHRPGIEELWVVSADASTLACAVLPGNAGLSGQYDMSFSFTIETLP